MNRPTEYRILRNGNFLDLVFSSNEEARDYIEFARSQSYLDATAEFEITTKREPGDPLYNEAMDNLHRIVKKDIVRDIEQSFDAEPS